LKVKVAAKGSSPSADETHPRASSRYVDARCVPLDCVVDHFARPIASSASGADRSGARERGPSLRLWLDQRVQPLALQVLRLQRRHDEPRGAQAPYPSLRQL